MRYGWILWGTRGQAQDSLPTVPLASVVDPQSALIIGALTESRIVGPPLAGGLQPVACNRWPAIGGLPRVASGRWNEQRSGRRGGCRAGRFDGDADGIQFAGLGVKSRIHLNGLADFEIAERRFAGRGLIFCRGS